MSSKAMSLKAKIRNYAKKNNIAAQVVLQNYMFERFLARLSESEYKDKFVIKGGMLIAAIVGLDTRSTMDLDATLRGLPLTEDQIRRAVESIGNVSLEDEVSFHIVSIEPIRKDDRYGGLRVRVDAIYDTMSTPLSMFRREISSHPGLSGMNSVEYSMRSSASDSGVTTWRPFWQRRQRPSSAVASLIPGQEIFTTSTFLQPVRNTAARFLKMRLRLRQSTEEAKR